MPRILLMVTLLLVGCSSKDAAPGKEKSKVASVEDGPPCKPGFEEKRGRCVDIDECGFVASVCGTPLAQCANKPGGYECTCPRGYAGGGPLGIACAPRVVAGAHASCAIPENGGVLCWGGIKGGIWGERYPKEIDTKPTPLEGADDAVAVTLGGQHGCILKRDATVACWGSSNEDGQLGNTSELGRPYPYLVERLKDVRMIAATTRHTCAVTRYGEVYCWGRNSTGQIGHEPTDPPQPVYWPRKVEVDQAVSVAIGLFHGCALRADGTVTCWGANDAGELGSGFAEHIDVFHAPMQIPGLSAVATLSECAALLNDGRPIFWGLDEINLRRVNEEVAGYKVYGPSAMPGVTSAVGVAGGNGWTCALATDGKVWCRGKGSLLGDGTRHDRAAAVMVNGIHDAVALSKDGLNACVVTGDGGVHCWGDNAWQKVAAGKPNMVLAPKRVADLQLMRP